MFITFEGIDGCGKSTQALLLAERLEREGRKVVSVRDPGQNVISEQIRAILLNANNHSMTATTELLLYSAARAQMVETIIVPALSEGAFVVCDRFTDSTIAYQGFGRGLSQEMIEHCIAVATNVQFGQSCTNPAAECGKRTHLVPSLTFILDVSLEESKRRSAGKRADRIELAGDDFFERVIKGYRVIAASQQPRCVLIDASRSKVEIHEEIWRRVESVI
jgi:dTMP kinase